MSGPRYDWLLEEPEYLDEEPREGEHEEPEPELIPPDRCRECGDVSAGWGLFFDLLGVAAAAPVTDPLDLDALAQELWNAPIGGMNMRHERRLLRSAQRLVVEADLYRAERADEYREIGPQTIERLRAAIEAMTGKPFRRHKYDFRRKCRSAKPGEGACGCAHYPNCKHVHERAE